MKLKASIDYGVRAVMYLAVKGDTCSSREISEEMAVPRDYLIQLALRLRRAGIVKARPGKNGGYLLAKDPADISVRDIMDAFDNDLKHARQEIKSKRRPNDTAKAVRAMHGTIMESLNAYLDCITIQSLIDAHESGEMDRALLADALEAEAARLRKPEPKPKRKKK
jgi:Rrf2 family protein